MRARSQQAAELVSLIFCLAMMLPGVLAGAGCSRRTPPQSAPAAPSDPAAARLGVENLVTGTGEIAATGMRVSVHYVGWLNGAKFDTSRDRRPLTFRLGVGDVLRGWDLGIPGMRVGGKRKLSVPSDLAYGHKGSLGGAIPPDSALVFEIELLSASDG